MQTLTPDRGLSRIGLFFICIVLFPALAYAQKNAKPGMYAGNNNYTSFSTTGVNPARDLPYNAPCQDCEEDLNARTEFTRSYRGKGDKAGLVYSQSSYSALNIKNAQGQWVPVDARLRPVGNGRYSAPDQHAPVSVDVAAGFGSIRNLYGEIRFNNRPELLWRSGDGTVRSLGKADFSAHTAGNDGVYIRDVWPGIDMEMRALLGGIKTNFILKNRPQQTEGTYLIRDAFGLDNGMRLVQNGDGLTVETSGGQEAFVVSACIGYDSQAQRANGVQSFFYALQGSVLDMEIPLSVLQDPNMVYPYTIDPLVNSSNTLPQASITGSSYNASCFVSYCSYNMTVPSPANATIVDALWSFNYVAAGSCWLYDGAVTYTSGACASPNQAGYYWFCNGIGTGTCTGSNISFFSDVAPCMPAPSCTPQNVPFQMRFYRCYNNTAGCSNSCIGAASPWTVTLVGQTVAVASASANGSGSTTICQGASATLNGQGQYGVPPYNYSWAPGGATGASISVSPGSSTTYTLTVTDACSQTSTANVTVNVTPQPAAPAISSNSPVCVGSSINLTGPAGAGTYVWSGPNGFSASVQNPSIPSATAAAGGTYSLYVVSGGCTSATATTTVNVVNPPAAPSFSTNSPVCEGATLTLTGSPLPFVNYVWSGPNGYSATGQTVNINPVTTAHAGTYSLVLTAAGCTSAAAVQTVVINPAPAPPLVGGNSPICAGSTLNLTATSVGSGTYSWTGPNAFSSTTQNPSIPSATAAHSGTYSAVYIESGCTSAVANYNVVVNPIPATPSVSSNSPVCVGNPINLSTSTTAGAYAWSGPNGFTSAAQNPSIAVSTLADAGTYNLSVIENGCTSAVTTVTVNVINPPSTPAFTTNSPVCEGATLTLTGTPLPIVNYVWSGPNGYSATGQSVNISPATAAHAGTYSLVLTASGCTSAAAVQTVVINPTPAAPVVGGNSPLCQGAALTLTATGSGGGSYSWTGPNAFSSTVQNPSISPVTAADAGTYSAVYIENGCTSAVANYTVTVNALPATPVASSNSPVCQGTPLNFSTPAVTGATYSWTGPNAFASGSQNPGIASATAADAGTYSVTVTVNGCTSAAGSTTVTVTPPPAAPVITSNSPVCETGTLQLGTTAIGSYNWSGPGAWVSTDQNPSLTGFLPGMAGTYSLYVVQNGCTSATSTVTVQMAPAPQVTYTGPYEVCGNTVTLTANVTVPPPATITTINWFAPNAIGSGASLTHTFTDTPPWAISGQVIAQSSDNCTMLVSFNVHLRDQPVADFTVQDLCDGESLQFHENHDWEGSSTGAPDFLWSYSGSTFSTGTDPTYDFGGPGTYNVTLAVSNPAMPACTDLMTQTVTVYPVPVLDFTYKAECVQDVQFTGTASPDSSVNVYQWDFTDGGTDTGAVATHAFTQPGLYQVELTAVTANNCTTSVAKPVQINQASSTLPDLPNALSINGDGVNESLDMGEIIGECGDFEFLIFNRWGQVVYTQKQGGAPFTGKSSMGSTLTAGVYFYTLILNDTKKSGSISIFR